MRVLSWVGRLRDGGGTPPAVDGDVGIGADDATIADGTDDAPGGQRRGVSASSGAGALGVRVERELTNRMAAEAGWGVTLRVKFLRPSFVVSLGVLVGLAFSAASAGVDGLAHVGSGGLNYLGLLLERLDESR